MKAIQISQFGDRSVLEYIDLHKPSPQNDDLLIEVTASGVNFVDIRERQASTNVPRLMSATTKACRASLACRWLGGSSRLALQGTAR
jgi:NADPH:quinone reductase-like Zn-dependent oxidoreductase